MSTLAGRERAAIVAEMRKVGPEAPTLCGDWTVRDLAAHLVVREGRPDAAPGILLPLLSGYTRSVQDQTARRDFEELLRRIASPPLYSPLRPVDRFVNAAEYFVHHEDVRRGQPEWTPRAFTADELSDLRTPTRLLARKTLAGGPAVRLLTPDGETFVTGGRGGTPVDVVGEFAELVLFVYGRAELDVEFRGPEAAVAALKAARRSV